jgi:hypothetical protein
MEPEKTELFETDECPQTDWEDCPCSQCVDRRFEETCSCDRCFELRRDAREAD